MSDRIGIGVGSTSVRVVLLRDERIVWAAESVIPSAAREDSSLRSTIVTLLARVPAKRWPRPRAYVALGPSVVQVRELTGLPPAKDHRTLSLMVRENQGRFFLRNGVPLVTCDVVITRNGTLGAAVERPVLDAVSAACRDARVTARAIMPACVALQSAVGEGSITWRDGEYTVEASRLGAHPMPRRLARPDDATDSNVTLASALAAFGPDAAVYADAFGAASLGSRSPLTFRVQGRAAPSSRVQRMRVATAWVLCFFALVALIATPGVASMRAATRAEARLVRLAPERRSAIQTQNDLRDVTLALTELSAFDRGRRSSIGILIAFTNALPDGSAMVAMRIDSLGGSIVVLSPRVAAVLGRLDAAPGFVGTEIVGPVTREVVAGRELERAAIKFRFARTTGAGQ